MRNQNQRCSSEQQREASAQERRDNNCRPLDRQPLKQDVSTIAHCDRGNCPHAKSDQTISNERQRCRRQVRHTYSIPTYFIRHMKVNMEEKYIKTPAGTRKRGRTNATSRCSGSNTPLFFRVNHSMKRSVNAPPQYAPAATPKNS